MISTFSIKNDICKNWTCTFSNILTVVFRLAIFKIFDIKIFFFSFFFLHIRTVNLRSYLFMYISAALMP